MSNLNSIRNFLFDTFTIGCCIQLRYCEFIFFLKKICFVYD